MPTDNNSGSGILPIPPPSWSPVEAPTSPPEKDIWKKGHFPVDPRLVERIQDRPRLLSEQKSDFMGAWGGPTTYKKMTSMGKDSRLVYAAILGGATTKDEIVTASGLHPNQVGPMLAWLQKKGLVTLDGVPPDGTPDDVPDDGTPDDVPDDGLPDGPPVPPVPPSDLEGDVKLVYDAIVGGATTEAEIVIITGLPDWKVHSIIYQVLLRWGYIIVEQVPIA